MLLTISTTHQPATDLGFLLHKNPARAQRFDLSFGVAHVFYPEAWRRDAPQRWCSTSTPAGLVRGRAGSGDSGVLAQYVNDRPCIASSFLSVALSQVLRSALYGQSKERSELADSPIPLGRLRSRGLHAKRSLALRELRSASRPSSASCVVSPCDGCMSASSGCSPWRARLSIRACSGGRAVEWIAHEHWSLPHKALDEAKALWSRFAADRSVS